MVLYAFGSQGRAYRRSYDDFRAHLVVASLISCMAGKPISVKRPPDSYR
jgi:hypothetical protein